MTTNPRGGLEHAGSSVTMTGPGPAAPAEAALLKAVPADVRRGDPESRGVEATRDDLVAMVKAINGATWPRV